MRNLNNNLTKELMSLGLLALISLPLEAQLPKESEYVADHKKENYCITKRGRETNLKKYKKINSNESCTLKSRKNISSKKYLPKHYISKNENYCISKQSRKYERKLKSKRK